MGAVRGAVAGMGLGLVALVALVAWRSASSGLSSISSALNSIKDGAAAAVDAVYQPENAVSASAGSYSGATNWQGAGDVSALVAYFQARGNTAVTRNEARAKGWSGDQISLAVATMGTMAGYY